MESPAWRAKGLIFENCSCHLLCPGHVSFKQRCDGDVCVGHWAIHITEGKFGTLSIDDLNVAVIFDAPPVMYEGNWRQRLYIDERADMHQRGALESIFAGKVGGPWETLGRFVATRLETRFAPVHFEETDDTKQVTVPGVFETTVRAIRGRDDRRAILSDLYNVVHGVAHVLCRGRTQCRDDVLAFTTDKTHGLFSGFSWAEPAHENSDTLSAPSEPPRE